MLPKFCIAASVFDDYFLARHVQSALSQRNRRNHRQKFRRQSNREGEREEQRLERIVAQHRIDKKHEQRPEETRFA